MDKLFLVLELLLSSGNSEDIMINVRGGEWAKQTFTPRIRWLGDDIEIEHSDGFIIIKKDRVRHYEFLESEDVTRVSVWFKSRSLVQITKLKGWGN